MPELGNRLDCETRGPKSPPRR